ncbi:MAG: Hsp70 family protein [Eisenbergiella sp.]
MFNDASSVEMEIHRDGEEGAAQTAQITRQEYAQACEPLLEKIRQPVKRSLSDARLKLSDIDVIVLVGGATRMQIVREFIIRLFRKFPDTNINPDEAVALGAAVQAAMKERKSEVKEVILTDVCPFTLGTDVVVSLGNGAQEAGHFCPIIERNTVIPASRTERFYTARDGQERISIKVLQGESRFAENNLYLGELELEVPKGPAGKESVDVTYTYDINSILEVEVTVVSTGETKKAIIKGEESELTDEQIAARMEELSYLKIQPRDREENKLVLLQAERAYEELLGEERRKMEWQIQRFEEALKDGDRDRIRTEREALKEQLDELW